MNVRVSCLWGECVGPYPCPTPRNAHAERRPAIFNWTHIGQACFPYRRATEGFGEAESCVALVRAICHGYYLLPESELEELSIDEVCLLIMMFSGPIYTQVVIRTPYGGLETRI